MTVVLNLLVADWSAPKVTTHITIIIKEGMHVAKDRNKY